MLKHIFYSHLGARLKNYSKGTKPAFQIQRNIRTFIVLFYDHKKKAFVCLTAETLNFTTVKSGPLIKSLETSLSILQFGIRVNMLSCI